MPRCMVGGQHEPQIHGHLFMAAPNGFGVATFPNKARDPLWDELYTRRPEIRDGMVHFTDDPGFGFEIEWKTVERYRSEEHTSELQSLMRISYAVFCLKKKKKKTTITQHTATTVHRNNKHKN